MAGPVIPGGKPSGQPIKRPAKKVKPGTLGARTVKLKGEQSLNPSVVNKILGARAGKSTKKEGFDLQSRTKVIAKRDSAIKRFFGAIAKALFKVDYHSIKLKISDERGTFSKKIGQEEFNKLKEKEREVQDKFLNMLILVTDKNKRPQRRADTFGNLCRLVGDHPQLFDEPAKRLEMLKKEMDGLKDIKRDLYESDYLIATNKLALLDLPPIEEMTPVERFDAEVKEVLANLYTLKEVASEKLDNIRDRVKKELTGDERPAFLQNLTFARADINRFLDSQRQEAKEVERSTVPKADNELEELLGALGSDVRAKPGVPETEGVTGGTFEDFEQIEGDLTSRVTPKPLQEETDPVAQFDNEVAKILKENPAKESQLNALELLRQRMQAELSDDEYDEIDKKFIQLYREILGA